MRDARSSPEMIKKIPGLFAVLMALALLSPMPQSHAAHVLPAVAAEYYCAEINEGEYRASQDSTQTWAVCWVQDNNSNIVRTFTKKGGPSGNSAYIKCGSPGWGNRHIKDRHMDDWDNIAVRMGDNWR